MRGDNYYLTVCNYLSRLICDHADILVIGEYEYDLGGCLHYRVKYILSRGVHRLSTRDDIVRTDVLEHCADTVAHTNADKAILLFDSSNGVFGLLLQGRLCLSLCLCFTARKSGMLILHILDLNGCKTTELDRLGKHRTGIVGVDMKLDDALIVNEHRAVTNTLYKLVKLARGILARVLFVLFNDTFRAIAELDIVGVELAEIRRCTALGNLGLFSNDGSALKRRVHTLKHANESVTARVNYSRLLENGKHLGSLRQCVCRTVFDHRKQLFNADPFVSGVRRLGSLSAHTHNCKYSSLCGLHYRAICLGSSSLEGFDDISRLCLTHVLERLCKASEEQRQYSARVSSCGTEHKRSYLLCTLTNRKIVCSTAYRAHRKTHIDTRISIGNRKHVEIVDLLHFVGKKCRTRHSHAFEQITCDIHITLSENYNSLIFTLSF